MSLPLLLVADDGDKGEEEEEEEDKGEEEEAVDDDGGLALVLEDGGAVTAARHKVVEKESAPNALRVRKRMPVRMKLECVRLLLHRWNKVIIMMPLRLLAPGVGWCLLYRLRGSSTR